MNLSSTIRFGKRNRNFYIIILVLLIFFIESSLSFSNVNARKEKVIGFSTVDSIKPKERVFYEFMNNNTFEILTDTYISLFIEY